MVQFTGPESPAIFNRIVPLSDPANTHYMPPLFRASTAAKNHIYISIILGIDAFDPIQLNDIAYIPQYNFYSHTVIEFVQEIAEFTRLLWKARSQLRFMGIGNMRTTNG